MLASRVVRDNAWRGGAGGLGARPVAGQARCRFETWRACKQPAYSNHLCSVLASERRVRDNQGFTFTSVTRFW